MMWETCRDTVLAKGSTLAMETTVTKIHHRDGRAVSVDATGADGSVTSHPCTEVISSMPISQLLEAMDPPVPADVKAAAADLRYRDYLIVALAMREELIDFDDNWIYIHEPKVRTMRIQNFGSWSPYMVKEGRNTLGLEYTVWYGDEEWNATDEWLVDRAKRELEELGLVKAGDIEDGWVVRQPKAYPIYDDRYRANVDVLRTWLAANAANVHPVGRNGMFRYNNQDHSMFTAMLTVENIMTGTTHDVWEVNVEEEYHEEATSRVKEKFLAEKAAGSHGTGRDAPVIKREVLEAHGRIPAEGGEPETPDRA
jgi:protoporphyrinogen oxidase